MPIEELIDNSVLKLKSLLNKYAKNDNKKAKNLSQWVGTYCKYIDSEQDFNPFSLKRYKRGEIIKVNLGFNVGNEEGGIHYCVVIDKNNQNSSGIITVIPLTSVKENKDTSKLRYGEVYIGTDFRDKVEQKLSMLSDKIYREVDHTFLESNLTIKNTNKVLSLLKEREKINEELKHMKDGSIVLVSQITTISKMKIYNPKKNNDTLSGIKLSDASLNKIDEKIKELFIYS